MKQVILIFVLISLALASSKDEDFIEALPGLSFTPTFKQYSGYLNGTTDNYKLHYWFVEAISESEKKPLIVWLNGGPGCSSLEGFLSENGPFTIKRGNVLTENKQSWSKLGNMVFLEAPAGVGFSYAKDKNVTTDDDLTAENNHAALKNFLERFPEYKGRDLFITGESYAGVYVPTLALKVLHDTEVRDSLKGIAVGNGLTSYEMNDNSLVYFAAYHGLIEPSDWKYLLDNCCGNGAQNRCKFSKSNTTECSDLLDKVENVIGDGLNIYNLYSECEGGVQHKFEKSNPENSFLRNPHDFATRQKLRLDPPCTDGSVIRNYLNDENVQKAIHVAGKPFDAPWDVCSTQVYGNYRRTYRELSKQYIDIFSTVRQIRMLIYNGDVDMACNFIGDEWFFDDVTAKEIGAFKYGERRKWMYVEEDGTEQIGGYTKWAKNGQATLTFVTIRGSGHMAPMDKPRATYRMIEAFIKNSDF